MQAVKHLKSRVSKLRVLSLISLIMAGGYCLAFPSYFYAFVMTLSVACYALGRAAAVSNRTNNEDLRDAVGIDYAHSKRIKGCYIENLDSSKIPVVNSLMVAIKCTIGALAITALGGIVGSVQNLSALQAGEVLAITGGDLILILTAVVAPLAVGYYTEYRASRVVDKTLFKETEEFLENHPELDPLHRL